MKSIALAGAAAVGLILAPLPSFAQGMDGMEMAVPSCTPMAAPPATLSGWTVKAPITSADKPAGVAAAALTPGQGALVTLHPTRSVSYVTQPEKPGGSVASGGLLSVVIADTGTYQVSLSSGAWIDVLRDGKALISMAHSPGPACSGIRKTVQFALQPGSYVVQLSANAAPMIQVMVSKVQ